jgi:hypothetical protein
VTLFAYPYGQADDFDPGPNGQSQQPASGPHAPQHFGRGSRPKEQFRLRRVGIEPDDTLEIVARRFDGAYDWVA